MSSLPPVRRTRCSSCGCTSMTSLRFISHSTIPLTRKYSWHPGSHKSEVIAEDNQGYVSSTILNVTVSSQSQATISDIQTLPGWQSCSALFPPGSGRDGQICAAGLGTAQSTLTQNQSTPAMDGRSAKFSMGGPTAYSNMLYFNAIAGGNNVSHFTYDLYFYI